MSTPTPFDFWYAVQNTHILHLPPRALETFGVTRIHYHLLTESMDNVDQVRVREGTLNAAQPQILTPQHFLQNAMEGFEDAESGKFMQWLRANHPEMRLLKYGFSISKQDVTDTLLHDNIQTVADNVLEIAKKRDDFSAVVVGVEQPWEVCLLKLMVDMVEKSMPQHISDLQQRNLIPNPNRMQQEIEAEFAAAEREPSRLPYLQKQLKRLNVFEQYQDRFFALVRRKGL